MPVAFVDDQLDRFETLLSLYIVSITHTDKPVAILHIEFFRAFLARLQM
jgi:hypothetical protein